MREAVDSTVERLKRFRPRRVLEVGCGTGLLLLRLAPDCEGYVGTDFSQVTLDGLDAVVRGSGLANVRLLQQSAGDVEGLGDETFDLIVLNSVVQYFPSAAYLALVIRRLLPRVAPGGTIFVGDVRSLPLAEALYASVELTLAAPDVSAETLRQRVQRRAAQELELVLAPEFFAALAHELPQIQRVDVNLKRGRHDNELTRFRYDVALRVGSDGPAAPVLLEEWPRAGLTADEIRTRLDAAPHGAIGFSDVLNARVAEAVRSAVVVAAAKPGSTVGDIRREVAASAGADAVDPEVFHDVAAAVHGAAHIRWAASGRVDTIDVVLTADRGALPPFPVPAAPRGALAGWANDPLQGAFMRELVPDLRRHLQIRLPDYMVPASFLLLERMPLGPNGKIDRAQLPAPDPVRARHSAYIAPRSKTEERLARLWSDVLGVAQIGVRDNFFTELGGHSLLGTQLMSRVRTTFGIDLPLFRLFEAPTIADLAAHIVRAAAGDREPAGLAHEPGLVPIEASQLSGADQDLIKRAMLAHTDGPQ